MSRNLFPLHTDWTEATCYYVAAYNVSRLALLAGPYRTRDEAERTLPAAQEWAVRGSDDPAAADYTYAVHESWNGHHRSILGEWTPPDLGLPHRFDAYEIAPCRRFEEPDRPGAYYFEPCEPQEADVWTLYGHLAGEGVEAIGDFDTRDAAVEIHARITGRRYSESDLQ